MAAGGGPDHWHRSPQESGPLGYTSPLGRVTSRLGSTARPPWTDPLGAGLLSTFRGCTAQISVRGCGAASAHARVRAFSLLATYLPPRRHLLLQPHHPCDAVDQAHLGLRGGLAPPLPLLTSSKEAGATLLAGRDSGGRTHCTLTPHGMALLFVNVRVHRRKRDGCPRGVPFSPLQVSTACLFRPKT